MREIKLGITGNSAKSTGKTGFELDLIHPKALIIGNLVGYGKSI